MMENTAYESLLTRRSIRRYSDQAVTDAELDAVLTAGLDAPSAMNSQGTYLVAVRNPEIRNQLSKMNAAVMGGQGDPFYGAPCVIVVLADPNCGIAVEDGSLVLGNLFNAAHAIGLGSCWIHRAREEFETTEGKALLHRWGLPENLVGIGHCILGHAAENPAIKPRKAGRIVKVD